MPFPGGGAILTVINGELSIRVWHELNNSRNQFEIEEINSKYRLNVIIISEIYITFFPVNIRTPTVTVSEPDNCSNGNRNCICSFNTHEIGNSFSLPTYKIQQSIKKEAVF